MYLYLSGAKYPNSEQTDMRVSLGGNISISTVPNGQLNTIFDDITSYGQSKKKKEIRAVFFRNDEDESMENLSVTQIYSNEFGKESKLVKYKWGIVATSNNQTMQKVGNPSSIPFGVDFFEPTAKREFLVAEVTRAGKPGDVLEMLNRTIILTSKGITDNILDIVSQFEDDEDFTVDIVDEKSFFVERKQLVFTNNDLEVVTPGNFKIKDVKFSGGFDNGVLIIEELKPGQAIGIWVQRETLPAPKIKCFDLEKEYDEYFGNEFSEETIQSEKQTEESLEVIFDWE